MSQTQGRAGAVGIRGGPRGEDSSLLPLLEHLRCTAPVFLAQLSQAQQTRLLSVTHCCPLQTLLDGSLSRPEEGAAQYELAVEGPTWNDPSDWDADTQKDWERFMRASRSREASTACCTVCKVHDLSSL